MPVSLEVNTNVIVFSLFMQIFDSSGSEERLHSEIVLEILGRGIVGIVGLNKANCWVSWNIQVDSLIFIQSLCLFF